MVDVVVTVDILYEFVVLNATLEAVRLLLLAFHLITAACIAVTATLDRCARNQRTASRPLRCAKMRC